LGIITKAERVIIRTGRIVRFKTLSSFHER
jgi:hypothetical protein